jgi:translation initiation factor IF-2
MADSEDKKPKAELIKHRKPKKQESSSNDAETKEKKKVVVVKKKPSKKHVTRVVAKKDDSSDKPNTKNTSRGSDSKSGSAASADNAERRPSRGTGRAGNLSDGSFKSPRKSTDGRAGNLRHGGRPQRSGQADRGGDFRGTRRPQGEGQRDSRPPYQGRPGQGGSGQGRPGQGRPGQGRPGQGRPGQGRPGQGRPGQGRPGQGRPGQGRPGQGRPGQGRPPMGGSRPSTPLPETGKGPGKKIFKAKKKSSFDRRDKQEHAEKMFQMKKKQQVKTNPVPKSIDITEAISISDLARKMNLKASEIISKLMGMGMMVTINQKVDSDTATLVASEYNCKVNIVSLYDETIIESEKDEDLELKTRPPIVTVMGHVDHGKTKLLDAIRSTNVVDDEFGGITQHIGAYKVEVDQGSVVFLDTPGHEAFTLMRARGAQITDIVVLVVAANDGVMPQTVEAVNHAKDAEVPIIVAVNKCDLPEANVDRVKQQLSEYNLIPEEWGGNTQFVEISALKRQGIDTLLESLVLQAEVLELKAPYDCRAEGKVLESKVDHGRGIVSTVIIERGTLEIGDAFVAGVYSGKVRALFNDRGKKIQSAGPADPVEILGFTGIPDSGSPFQVTENEKVARQVGAKRQELEKLGQAGNVKKVTLDNLYDSIQHGTIQALKVVIKGDVQGSVEALKAALEKLSTPEIRLEVINSAAGAIVENDVNLAVASNAIIVGFHVRPTPKAQTLAEREKVEIKKYNIIYDAVEDIRSAMEGLLAPELKEVSIGTVEVRETFKVPKIGTIAGSYVQEGKIKRGSLLRVYREGVEIHAGKISSLKRFKDDAKEVAANYECGIGIENFDDLQTGDIFEVYEMEEVAKKLSAPNGKGNE